MSAHLSLIGCGEPSCSDPTRIHVHFIGKIIVGDITASDCKSFRWWEGITTECRTRRQGKFRKKRSLVKCL